MGKESQQEPMASASTNKVGSLVPDLLSRQEKQLESFMERLESFVDICDKDNKDYNLVRGHCISAYTLLGHAKYQIRDLIKLNKG